MFHRFRRNQCSGRGVVSVPSWLLPLRLPALLLPLACHCSFASEPDGTPPSLVPRRWSNRAIHTIPRTGDGVENQRGIQKRYGKLIMCSDLPERPLVPGEAPIRGQLTSNWLPPWPSPP